MGYLIGVRCSDRDKRDAAIASVIDKFPALFGNHWQRFEWADFSFACAPGNAMPLQWIASDSHVHFRLGYTHALDAIEPESLEAIAEDCRDAPQRIAGRDGYYLAGKVDRSGSIWLGTDQLGCFPLYVHSAGDLLAFAAAPGLLAAMPEFRREVSRVGLAGILLVGYQSLQEGLWKNILRPPPRSAVELAYGKAPHFIALPDVEREMTDDLDVAVERLDAAMRISARRCLALAGDKGLAMSLSGGLDSRMVAGYLASEGANSVKAFTLGRHSDYEAQAAHAVARTLGWEFQLVEPSTEQCIQDALLQSRLEFGSSVLQSSVWWEGARQSALWGRWLVSGLMGDATVGAALTGVGWVNGNDAPAFETTLAGLRATGLPLDSVKLLLQDHGGNETIEQAMAGLHSLWDGLPGPVAARAMHFGLALRGRFNPAPVSWIYSCAAGTSLPLATNGVMAVIESIEPKATLGRVLQKKLVIEKFPALARLPIDRNTLDDSPLIPSMRSRLRDLFRPWRLRMIEQRFGLERRFYHRVMHPDNGLWRELRQIADRAHGGPLDRELIRSLLPAPDAAFPLPPDPFAGMMGRRALIQLLIATAETD